MLFNDRNSLILTKDDVELKKVDGSQEQQEQEQHT